MTKTISVIVPIHNEAAGLAHFLDQMLLPVLADISKKYHTELILVDDGSKDQTLSIIQGYAEKGSKLSPSTTIRALALTRNFGKEMALSAGLRYAVGDAALTIDADGQQPPKLIPKFIAEWEAGHEIVIGVRDHYTKHGLIPRLGSKLFYGLLHMMGNDNTVSGSTDFRLLDRAVIDEYNTITEHNRITRGVIDWLGYDKKYIEYTYGARFAGKPNYNLKKLFHLAIDSFVSMSTTPLVIFGYLGALITVGSFILGMFCIINQYILGDPLGLYWNGAVQMAIFITFLVGLLMISQSVTALYISHIHAETQNRPLFIVNHKTSRNIKKLR